MSRLRPRTYHRVQLCVGCWHDRDRARREISEAIGRVRFRDLISAARSTLEQRIGSPEVSKAPAGKPTRSRSDYDAAGASTRNSTESSLFGESGFASNKTQRLSCPCRFEGSSFRLRSQKFACEAENFACETLSFRASPRKCLKSLVAKSVRFAVSIDDIRCCVRFYFARFFASSRCFQSFDGRYFRPLSEQKNQAITIFAF
jgi:hypothetical protein